MIPRVEGLIRRSVGLMMESLRRPLDRWPSPGRYDERGLGTLRGGSSMARAHLAAQTYSLGLARKTLESFSWLC